MPNAPLVEEQPTILQALQAALAVQVAVLGDEGLTGTGQSSTEVLGLSVEEITQTLVDSVVQEIVARGAGGGPLAALANQLNHNLTQLQGERAAGMLARIADKLVRPTQASGTIDGAGTSVKGVLSSSVAAEIDALRSYATQFTSAKVIVFPAHQVPLAREIASLFELAGWKSTL